jgi:hypothetical protein
MAGLEGVSCKLARPEPVRGHLDLAGYTLHHLFDY